MTNIKSIGNRQHERDMQCRFVLVDFRDSADPPDPRWDLWERGVEFWGQPATVYRTRSASMPPSSSAQLHLFPRFTISRSFSLLQRAAEGQKTLIRAGTGARPALSEMVKHFWTPDDAGWIFSLASQWAARENVEAPDMILDRERFETYAKMHFEIWPDPDPIWNAPLPLTRSEAQSAGRLQMTSSELVASIRQEHGRWIYETGTGSFLRPHGAADTLQEAQAMAAAVVQAQWLGRLESILDARGGSVRWGAPLLTPGPVQIRESGQLRQQERLYRERFFRKLDSIYGSTTVGSESNTYHTATIFFRACGHRQHGLEVAIGPVPGETERQAEVIEIDWLGDDRDPELTASCLSVGVFRRFFPPFQ